MTQFSFTRYTDENDPPRFDPFGRPRSQLQIACPRGWRGINDEPSEGYLATRTDTIYAVPDAEAVYIHDRVARTTSYELTGTADKRVHELAATQASSPMLKLIGQSRSLYDGPAFVGLPLTKLGKYGALTRTERLMLTDAILQAAYGSEAPPYLEPTGVTAWTDDDYPEEFRTLLTHRAGYTFHVGSADPADPRGYFVNAERLGYDFQLGGEGRGLVLERLDPLHQGGADSTAPEESTLQAPERSRVDHSCSDA
jgi:hypothetical protein